MNIDFAKIDFGGAGNIVSDFPPQVPENDGTYVLKAIVQEGAIVYEWVLEA